MSDRVTKSMVEYRFSKLCKALGKEEAKSWNHVGAWKLDNYPMYGGYNIVEIANEGGVESNPFGARRHKAAEMVEMLDFAMEVLAHKCGERK